MAKKFSTAKLPRKVIVDIASLEKERDRLYVSGEDSERLKEVISIVDFFHFGIVYKEPENEE